MHLLESIYYSYVRTVQSQAPRSPITQNLARNQKGERGPEQGHAVQSTTSHIQILTEYNL